MLFLITNWKTILVGLAAFFLGMAIGYQAGEFVGKKIGREEVKTEIVQKDLDKKVKHAEIRNHRPDNDALVKRLLDGKF